MRRNIIVIMMVSFVFVLLGAACAERSTRQLPPQYAGVPDSAEKTSPLKVGQVVPAATVRTMQGEPVDLAALVRERPTILVFYRGGWCPYCNTHLGELKLVEKELRELGYQIVALSPDGPEQLRQTAASRKLTYTLMSDGDMEAAVAFGLAFQVSEQALAFQSLGGIDLAKRSGKPYYLLPVPAAYVVKTDGSIAFAYADPNYRARVDRNRLIAAAKAAVR